MAEDVPHTRQLTAIRTAQIARLNLAGLLIAYKISPQQLPILLKVPQPVERALTAQQAALTTLAALLATENGVDNWAAFPTRGKAEFMALAFELVDSMPALLVPHASTPP
jgi:hypothetical protein